MGDVLTDDDAISSAVPDDRVDGRVDDRVDDRVDGRASASRDDGPSLADLGAALGELPEPVVVTDDCGTVLWGNRAMERLVEDPLEAWLGRSFLDAIHPDCGLSVLNALASVTVLPTGEQGALLRLRLVTGSGAVREVETRGGMMRVEGRDLLVNVLRDVDGRFATDVHDGDPNRLRTLIDHSPAILMLLDSDLRVLSASGALSRLLGHDEYLVRGRQLTELVAPDHRSRLVRALSGIEVHAVLAVDLPDVWGGLRHFDAHFADLRMDPSVGAIVATLTDVSDLKAAERRLRDLADVDPLTGALNRRAFTASLSEALDATTDVSVLFIDLDRFKPINDVHGHAAGDTVLVEVVDRLRCAVRGADLVGRLGGDEFAVGLVGEATQGTDPTIDRITSAFDVAIDLGRAAITVSASIGSATARPGERAHEVIRRADVAMYQHKAARNRRAGATSSTSAGS